MFEKFTEGAIKVIMLAQEEARRMGHNFVGTEQILMGLIGQKHGIGARALAQLNITAKKTRKEIEKYLGRGRGYVASEIPFTPRAKRVLEMAIHEAKDLAVSYVGTEHVLLSLINERDGIALRILSQLGVNIPKLRHVTLTYIEDQQENILERIPTPWDTANPEVDLSLLDRGRTKQAARKKKSQTPALDQFTANLTEEAEKGELDPVIGRNNEIADIMKVLSRRRKNNPVLLGEAGVGKTACAEGVAQIVAASRKGENERDDDNGKEYMTSNKQQHTIPAQMPCPEFLTGHQIRCLDLGAVLAGTKYRGEFEERMKQIVDEIKLHGKTVLVIDEIHTIVGAGAAEGAVDAANLLKPALARGSLRCIGATTLDEYHKYIEKDPALERRFCPIIINEPSVETTITILFGLQYEFARHHHLQFRPEAFEQAASLSHRFVSDRNLPDKAIDVIDESASYVRLLNRQFPTGVQRLLDELNATITAKEDAIKDNEFDLLEDLYDHEIEVRTHLRIMQLALTTKEEFNFLTEEKRELDQVTESHVREVVSSWTGIPTQKLTESEGQKLLVMEDYLHERLIGQHHAIIAVSKAVRRARVGLGDPKRPIASFIFAGPTGVGKTELTKTLAEFMFGNESSMIRFDMSEFMERHSVSKLVGSPPGYVGSQDGGQLTEAVRRKQYSIVLFDEVEKAHPDVFNLFLQILDDGHLTDSGGIKVNFKNTIIVMTTNIGARVIEAESPILDRPKIGFTNLLEKYETEPVKVKYRPTGDLTIDPPTRREITKEDTQKFEKITGLVQEELKKIFPPRIFKSNR